MEACWLIETGVFERTAPGITAALDAAGIDWVGYRDDMPAAELPSVDRPVLFWGSLGAAYDERVADRYTPGAVGDIARFACSSYYPALADCDLANADCVFATAAQLAWVPHHALAPLGMPAEIFVRPDSALKPFAGRTIRVDKLSLVALDHGFYYEDEHLPCVASTAKRVTSEWRFVIANRRVVAASAYTAARRAASADIPAAATALATRVATHPWQAADLYIADIGDVDGHIRLLELNPFSGADLYTCDPTAVVTAATEVATSAFGGRGG